MAFNSEIEFEFLLLNVDFSVEEFYDYENNTVKTRVTINNPNNIISYQTWTSSSTYINGQDRMVIPLNGYNFVKTINMYNESVSDISIYKPTCVLRVGDQKYFLTVEKFNHSGSPLDRDDSTSFKDSISTSNGISFVCTNNFTNLNENRNGKRMQKVPEGQHNGKFNFSPLKFKHIDHNDVLKSFLEENGRKYINHDSKSGKKYGMGDIEHILYHSLSVDGKTNERRKDYNFILEDNCDITLKNNKTTVITIKNPKMISVYEDWNEDSGENNNHHKRDFNKITASQLVQHVDKFNNNTNLDHEHSTKLAQFNPTVYLEVNTDQGVMPFISIIKKMTINHNSLDSTSLTLLQEADTIFTIELENNRMIDPNGNILSNPTTMTNKKIFMNIDSASAGLEINSQSNMFYSVGLFALADGAINGNIDLNRMFGVENLTENIDLIVAESGIYDTVTTSSLALDSGIIESAKSSSSQKQNALPALAPVMKVEPEPVKKAQSEPVKRTFTSLEKMLFGEPIDTISERKPKVETKKQDIVISKADELAFEPTEAPQLTEPVFSDERTGPPVFNFKVTVDENGVFVLDGDVAPFLRFSTKCKYVFDQSHESNAGKRILFGRENGQIQYFSDKIINSKALPGTPYSNVTINMGDSFDVTNLYYYWKGTPDSGNAIGIINHSTIRGSGVPPKLWVSLVGMLYLFNVNQNRNAFLSLMGEYDSGTSTNNSKSIKQRKKDLSSESTTVKRFYTSSITDGFTSYIPKVNLEIPGNSISVSQSSFLLTQEEEFLSVEYFKNNSSKLDTIYLTDQSKNPVEISKMHYDAIKSYIGECKFPNFCYVKIRPSYLEQSQIKLIKEYYGWEAVPIVKKERKDPSKFTIKLQGTQYSSDSYIDMYPINFNIEVKKISELSDIEFMYVHYISNTYGINLDEIIKENLEEFEDADYLNGVDTFVNFVTGEKGRKIPISVFQIRFADMNYLGSKWIDLNPLQIFNPNIKGGYKQLHDLNPVELDTIEYLIKTGNLNIGDLIKDDISDFDNKQNRIVLDDQSSFIDEASKQNTLNNPVTVETDEMTLKTVATFTFGDKDYPGNYYINMSPITGGGIKQLQSLSLEELQSILDAINNEGFDVDPLIKPTSSELATLLEISSVSSVGEKVITGEQGDLYLEKHVSDMLININGKSYPGSDFIDMRAITGGRITKLSGITPVEHAYIKYTVKKLNLNFQAFLSSDYDTLSNRKVNSGSLLKVNNSFGQSDSANKEYTIFNGKSYPSGDYVNMAVLNSDEGVKRLSELTSNQIEELENEIVENELKIDNIIQDNISVFDIVTSDGYHYPANCEIVIPINMLTDTQVDQYMVGKKEGAEILNVSVETEEDWNKYFGFPKRFVENEGSVKLEFIDSKFVTNSKGFGRRTKEDKYLNSFLEGTFLPNNEQTVDEYAQRMPNNEMTMEDQAQNIPYGVETDQAQMILDGVETDQAQMILDGVDSGWTTADSPRVTNNFDKYLKRGGLEQQFKFTIKPILENIYSDRIFEEEQFIEEKMPKGLILKKTKSGGAPLNVKMKPDGDPLYATGTPVNWGVGRDEAGYYEAGQAPINPATGLPFDGVYTVPPTREQRAMPPELPPRAYNEATYVAMNAPKPTIGAIRPEMLRPMRQSVEEIHRGLQESTSARLGDKPVTIVGTPSTKQNPPAVITEDPVTGDPLVPVGGNRVIFENPLTGGNLRVENWRRLNVDAEEELPPVPGEGTANSGGGSIYDSPAPPTVAQLNSLPPNPKPGRGLVQPQRVILRATVGCQLSPTGKGLSKALAIRLKDECDGIGDEVDIFEMTGEELQRYVDFAIQSTKRLDFMGYDAAKLAIELAIEAEFLVPSPDGDMDTRMIDDISIKIGIEEYIGIDVLSSEDINKLVKGVNEVLTDLGAVSNIQIQNVRDGLKGGIEVYAEQNPEFKAVLNKGKLDISQLVDHVVVTSLVKNEIRGFTNTLEQVTKLFSDPEEINTKEQYRQEVVNRFGDKMADVFDNLQSQYGKSPKDAFSDITGSIAEAIQITNETFIQGATGGVEGGYERVFRKELADAFNRKIGLPGSVETPVSMDRVILQKFTDASVEVVQKINSITLSKQSYDTAIKKILAEEASIMASYVKETPYIKKMKEYGLSEKDAHERLMDELSKASEQVTLDMMTDLHNGSLPGFSVNIIDTQLIEKFKTRIEANLNSSLNEQYEKRKAELQEEQTEAERIANEEAVKETTKGFFEFV